jgi:serine/threonine-protein kinase RsbT
MSELTRGKVPIKSENDIVAARRAVRDLATGLSFGVTDVTRIITAASELARNVFLYAGSGMMSWSTLDRNGDAGLELKFEDHGPGIADIGLAMTPGYSSTRQGLGLGLPGAKRLMDEMEIHSELEKGTTVIVRKWLHK